MEELLNAISIVGFPIVAYGAMFWYMVELNTQHKEEMDTIRKSLDSNTVALVELRELVNSLVNNDNKSEKVQ
jgi:hypothetical protein